MLMFTHLLSRRAACLWALATAVAPAAAQIRIEGGHVFPAQAQVNGQTLILNGAGYRAVAWFKGYAAALYLGRRAGSAADVLAADGPKRLQMKMLVGVSAQEFVKAFGKGVARNTPAADMPALQARIRQFEEMIASLVEVKKGDLVDLDFLPAQGLVFAVNGVQRGAAVPGADFFAALLRSFIGERPFDKEMKTGLLGGPLA